MGPPEPAPSPSQASQFVAPATAPVPPASPSQPAPAALLPPAAGEMVTLEEAERRAITAAFARAGGNKNEAARLLGIDRQRLYRKLEKYQIH